MKPMHMNRLGGLGSFGSLAAVAMVVAMLGGCAPQTLRLGPSVRLPSGAPMSECERLINEGHFPPGSMGPKVEAIHGFLKRGGRRGLITSAEKLASP